MNKAFLSFVRRCFIALALLALISPAALADDATADTWYFGGTGQETIYEATPLPNGCLLLNGSTQLGRNGQEQLAFESREKRAWLLCLNPDLSVAWEVIDDAKGTTRYVVPQVLQDGRIAVLYYNSPSQVTVEAAIRYFTQDGEPAGEVPLPAESPFDLPGDRCAGGYVFAGYDMEMVFVDESGSRILPGEEEPKVHGSQRDALATADGRIVAGSCYSNGERRAAIVCMDAQGTERWRFSPDEYAEGAFGFPYLQSDGSVIFALLQKEPGADERTITRILCLDAEGGLLWDHPMPDGAGTTFAPVEGGFILARCQLEKTYMHIRFTRVDESGQALEVREAEPRKDGFSGDKLFFWNGEAWLLYNAERAANRVNDQQAELELADGALVRVSACPPAGAQDAP